MVDVCNSCGAPTRLICKHCPMLLCDRCRRNHESVCEQVQKMKARGQGPTVLRKKEK